MKAYEKIFLLLKSMTTWTNFVACVMEIGNRQSIALGYEKPRKTRSLPTQQMLIGGIEINHILWIVVLT